MSKIVQFKRGSTATENARTGALGELTIDTTLKEIRLHDGVTAGGKRIGGGTDGVVADTPNTLVLRDEDGAIFAEDGNFNKVYANILYGQFVGSYTGDGTGSFAGSLSGNGSGITDIDASNISSGTIDTARLGSGSPDNTNFLRGDGTWQTVSGSAAAGGTEGSIQYNSGGVLAGHTLITATATGWDWGDGTANDLGANRYRADVDGSLYDIFYTGGSAQWILGMLGTVIGPTTDYTIRDLANGVSNISCHQMGDVSFGRDIDVDGVINVGAVQVIAARKAAVDYATGAGDVVARLNELIDRLQDGSGHGLIESNA